MKKTVKAFGKKYRVTYTEVGEGVNISEVIEVHLFGSKVLGLVAWRWTGLGEEIRRQLKK